MADIDGPEMAERSSEAAGTPRWVKVSWIIAAIVVVLFVILLLFGGEHGPGRHSAPQGNEGHTSPMTMP